MINMGIIPQPNTNLIINADSLTALREMPENSVYSVVTDPPYGLSFMGKKWDYDVPSVELWKEVFRVLKPGAFLLSFAGTRTYHRMAVNIEDAGFEIRDMISWLYGSGFPKSLNIGKQIDKINGNEREEYIEKRNGGGIKKKQSYEGGFEVNSGERLASKGNSAWEGWGTALKPACEPIVVARKPLSEKNIASNVLKWGTGGINIDGCRIEHNEPLKEANRSGRKNASVMNDDSCGFDNTKNTLASASPNGRFPANIILDEEAGKILDEQTGNLGKSSGGKGVKSMGALGDSKYGKYNKKLGENAGGLGDSGGASRFFYCAKAGKKERNIGCEELEGKPIDIQQPHNSKDLEERYKMTSKNNHPTVKPIKLMQYLVRLVTPKGAICLDPFLGSGTTACACIKEGMNYIGIEREADYIKIINARIKAVEDSPKP